MTTAEHCRQAASMFEQMAIDFNVATKSPENKRYASLLQDASVRLLLDRACHLRMAAIIADEHDDTTGKV